MGRGKKEVPGTSGFISHVLFHRHNTAYYGLLLNLTIDFRRRLLSVFREGFFLGGVEIYIVFIFFFNSEKAGFNVSGAFLTCYHSTGLCALRGYRCPQCCSWHSSQGVLWALQTPSAYFLCEVLGQPIWSHQILSLTGFPFKGAIS